MNEIELRHQFHQLAEISGREEKTHTLILENLREMNPSQIFTFQDNYNILAEFKFSEKGKTILFRADFDALNIDETLDIPYQSNCEGVSHKCGHDGHTVILLTLAHYLQKKSLKEGTILLLFQSSEEIGEGMQQFLNEKIIENYHLDYVFALHNIPGIAENTVICREDSFTCSVISLDIYLHGKTAHAAEPQNGISPLSAAIEITQRILSENNPNLYDDQYKIATLIELHIGEAAYGVSPGEGTLRFTIRAKNDDLLQQFMKGIEMMVSEVVSQIPDLHYSMHKLQYFAACNNDEDAVHKIFKAAKKQQLPSIHKSVPYTWGEDFGLLTQHYRGAMFGFGAGEDCFPLHHEYYDFPDGIIRNAANMFYELINQVSEDKT